MGRSNVDRQPFDWARYVYITNQHCTKEGFCNYLAPLDHPEAPMISRLRYFTSLPSEVLYLPLFGGYWVPPDSKVTAPSVRE